MYAWTDVRWSSECGRYAWTESEPGVGTLIGTVDVFYSYHSPLEGNGRNPRKI